MDARLRPNHLYALMRRGQTLSAPAYSSILRGPRGPSRGNATDRGGPFRNFHESVAPVRVVRRGANLSSDGAGVPRPVRGPAARRHDERQPLVDVFSHRRMRRRHGRPAGGQRILHRQARSLGPRRVQIVGAGTGQFDHLFVGKVGGNHSQLATVAESKPLKKLSTLCSPSCAIVLLTTSLSTTLHRQRRPTRPKTS